MIKKIILPAHVDNYHKMLEFIRFVAVASKEQYIKDHAARLIEQMGEKV